MERKKRWTRWIFLLSKTVRKQSVCHEKENAAGKTCLATAAAAIRVVRAPGKCCTVIDYNCNPWQALIRTKLPIEEKLRLLVQGLPMISARIRLIDGVTGLLTVPPLLLV